MKRLTSCLFVLVFLFAAFQSPGTSRAQSASTVTIAFLQAEPDQLDTVKAASLDDYQVLWNKPGLSRA